MSKSQKVDVNQILLDRIQALEEENFLLKEENSKLRGEKLAQGRIHRHPTLKATSPLYQSNFDGVYTIPELWKRAVDKYRSDLLFGYRIVKSISKEEKAIDGVTKEWEIIEFDEKVRWMTYEMVDKMVSAIGSGVVQWGKLKHGDRVGIYMDTKREWMQFALGCFQHGLVVATAYANLGEDALVHVINECELTMILTDHSLVGMLERVASQCPTLKKVVYVGVTNLEFESKHFELMSYGNLTRLGMDNRNHPLKPPERNDISVIMYTSGSTGVPKGVMITHNNLVSSAAALGQTLSLTPTDCFLAYLPLAHIFELSVELCMITYGCRIGYGSARTLTEKFCRPCGDLHAIGPSLLAGVPRVYETIRKGIIQKVRDGSPIRRLLFDRAFNEKLRALRNNQSSPIWDMVIFNKVKKMAGLSNIRVMVSGGAALNADTMEFLKVVFSTSVIQGYGLTETCSGGCVQDPTKFSIGNVGLPIRSCELRLVDVPDMGYFHLDDPPRGEICIKGNNVSVGYFKNQKATDEVFKNGWFHTGDIGQWNPDGTLSIIDRKKNLVKLSNGEYVALENLEMIYNLCPYVSPNGICLYADAYKDFVVALIQPQWPSIKSWAQEQGINKDTQELLHDESLKAEILKSLKGIGLTAKKKTFELVANIHLIDGEWTPENGALTAAMKLQRQNIYKMWRSDVDRLYDEGRAL